MEAFCVNCTERAVQRHHAVYEQELRRRSSGGSQKAQWMADWRNLVPVCKRCHERHHTRFFPLSVSALPDSVFEFAVELMGAGAAYEYLLRYYRNEQGDTRLERLLHAGSEDGPERAILGEGGS